MGSIGPVSEAAELAIPVIDLEPVRSGSTEEALAAGKKIYEAFRDVGFAYIRGHGVPQQDIDNAFAWVSSSIVHCPFVGRKLRILPCMIYHD